MPLEFNPEEFYLSYPQEVISRPGYPARAAYKSKLLWDLFGKEVLESAGQIHKYADIGGCFGFGANSLAYHISKSQKSNVNTHVFEISKDFIKIGSQLFPRIDFHPEAFEDWRGVPQSFDLISLFDLVEHLPDPKPLLKSVASRARFVLLKTPLETYGEWWRGARATTPQGNEHPDGHVQFFTPKTYEQLLSDCGLEIISSKIVPSIITKGAEGVINPEIDEQVSRYPVLSTLRHPVLSISRQLPFSISRKILGFGDHLSLCRSI